MCTLLFASASSIWSEAAVSNRSALLSCRDAVLPLISNGWLRKPDKQIPNAANRIVSGPFSCNRFFTHRSVSTLIQSGTFQCKAVLSRTPGCTSSEPKQRSRRMQRLSLSSQASQTQIRDRQPQDADSRVIRLYRGPYIRQIAFFMRCALPQLSSMAFGWFAFLLT
jgi:hypothetical protein